MTILFSTSNAHQEDPHPMDDDLEVLQEVTNKKEKVPDREEEVQAEPDHAKPKLKPWVYDDILISLLWYWYIMTNIGALSRLPYVTSSVPWSGGAQ